MRRLQAHAVTSETIELADLAVAIGLALAGCMRGVVDAAVCAEAAGILRAVADCGRGRGAARPVRGACDAVEPESEVVSATATPGEDSSAQPKISAAAMMPMRTTYLACTMGAPRDGGQSTDGEANSVTHARYAEAIL